MQNDKFAPRSYFFTHATAFTQAAHQAFGAVNANQFKITSVFSLTENTPAYAVCKGVVLIQPQTGSPGKVNLILRPFQQPVQGINIRYFIYRGLQISDFFSGNQVTASTTGSSDFITKINEQFESFYNDIGGTKPDFLSKYIGYDPDNQTDNLLLDSFFFKQSQYAESNGEFTEDDALSYELPVIDAGKSLGNFATGDCGIDVVLSNGDYQQPDTAGNFVFNLAYARAQEAFIDLTTETAPFKRKIQREQIYQFIDIAAYYGFHASTDKGIVKINNGETTLTIKGVQIYDDVLPQFYTKNRLYLYINSDRGRSYNFYNNYQIAEDNSNTLKVGHTEDSLAETTYVNNGWPLLIIEQAQNHDENTNKLYLQLVTDNNPNAMFYGQVAAVDNAQTNNFIDADNLPQPVEEEEDPSIFTKTIVLSNPAAGQAGSKHTIATFNLLHYHGKTYNYLAGQIINEDEEEEDVYATPNFFDDVFGELQATPLLQATIDNSYSSVSFEKLRLINHYYDKRQQGISAVQTVMVNDEIATEEGEPTLKRVTYVTESVDVLNDVTSVYNSVNSRTTSSSSFTGTVNDISTYQLPYPFIYYTNFFSDGMDSVNGIILKTEDNSFSSKIILGLSEKENTFLKELIITNQLINSTLFLLDLFINEVLFEAPENISYMKYRVGVVGEDNQGKLRLYMPDEDIIVYSLDRKYHFTLEYSKYMQQSIEEPDYFIEQYPFL